MTGKVVSREEWLEARKALLVKEKEISRATAKLDDELRDFPMVKVTKDYVFHTAEGKDMKLADLFEDRQQLIVCHFMLEPDSEMGCEGCSFLVDNLPNLCHLNYLNTTFTCVSRAPIEKIEAYKKRGGWKFPWVSSYGSDFNYDYHVTLDENVAPIEYNYNNKAELEAKGLNWVLKGGEVPGFSVFFKEGDEVFHTYTQYAFGRDRVATTLQLLDMTPLGRPKGLGVKRNFEYGDED